MLRSVAKRARKPTITIYETLQQIRMLVGVDALKQENIKYTDKMALFKIFFIFQAFLTVRT